MFKTIEDAALAVDEMFNQAFENAGRTYSLLHLSQAAPLIFNLQLLAAMIVLMTAATRMTDQKVQKMRTRN
jgi:hypothetical protein